MKFGELVKELKKTALDFTVSNEDANCADINFLTADGRKVLGGTIFACVKGEHADGHSYASDAVKRGACALVCEKKLDVDVPQIICADVRRNMGLVAASLYGKPAEKLKMLAITGTTGKTTSTFMTKAILDYAGIKCGLLGTVCYDDGAERTEAPRTTPEADIIQYKLSKMVENGCRACVMEASSHAIVQGRLEGCLFDAAGFTNLTQDHLDYHGTMESYFEAKKQLFEKYMRGSWKVSAFADNEYSRRICTEYKNHAVSYSLANSDADCSAEILSVSASGTGIRLKINGQIYEAVLPVIGMHNVLNAMQALTLAGFFGVKTETAVKALKAMPQIPGRLERYMIKNSGCCVIDFAHAPDGMEKLLTALRSVCGGKLIAVFGAGGDRDKAKRPLMGEIGSRLADCVILTNDNPRSENPETIIDALEAGAKQHTAECLRITDRRKAIYHALSMMTKDDIVAIIGKGPETYMEINGKKIPFNDKEILSDWCTEEGREIE